MTTAKRSFGPDLFKFLRELREHNDREWFAANKRRYQETVQGPALEFVRDFAPALRRISPHFKADARPVGGSLFRIHRDIRFSRDKSPYKTHVGIHFRHEHARDAHAPAFYLHLEPGDCFVGVGVWHPDAQAALRVRTAIAQRPGDWKKAARDKRFSGVFELRGDSLKRPPAAFDPEHPYIEDIRRKDFVGLAPLSQRAVTAPGFADEFAALCRTGSGLVRFVCDALDIPY